MTVNQRALKRCFLSGAVNGLFHGGATNPCAGILQQGMNGIDMAVFNERGGNTFGDHNTARHAGLMRAAFGTHDFNEITIGKHRTVLKDWRSYRNLVLGKLIDKIFGRGIDRGYPIGKFGAGLNIGFA